MAWLQMYTRSAALKMPVGFHALIPPHWDADRGGPYPALYLLHGLRDDASSWLRNSMLEFHLRGRPLAVIMPNGYNGFWADAKTGQNYMTYVTEELPGLCERWFPLSPRREDRFVAGFSMGAFGALLAALNNPRRFARAGAISPVTDLSPHYGGPRNPKLTVDLPWIFGDPEEYRSGPGNLFAAAERAAASGEGTPEFLITCGREDSLYEGAEKLAGRLAELGLSSRFHPAGGIHDWTYADRALQTILDWLAGKEA